MNKDPQNYSYENIKEMITNAKTSEAQQVGALAYATGARVSELISITRKDVKEDKDYMQISCPVLKKRIVTTENSTRIALVRGDEDWLVVPIRELCVGKQPTDLLVPYYRTKVYRLLIKNFEFNPHFFRKLRATHLAQKGFTAHQLKHFFGWASVSPSDYYVRLNTDDLKY